jgi:hypothetical protein
MNSKNKFREMLRDVVERCCSKKSSTRRVRLLLNDQMALDGQTKCDLNAVKVDLKVVLVS